MRPTADGGSSGGTGRFHRPAGGLPFGIAVDQPVQDMLAAPADVQESGAAQTLKVLRRVAHRETGQPGHGVYAALPLVEKTGKAIVWVQFN